MKKLYDSGIFKLVAARWPKPQAEAKEIIEALHKYAGLELSGTVPVELVKEIINEKLRLWKTEYITLTYRLDNGRYARLLSDITGAQVEFNNGVPRVRIDGKYTEGRKAWGVLNEKIREKGYNVYGRDMYHGLHFDKMHFTLSPYQILMMSTCKPWTSCTNIGDGQYGATGVVYSQLPFYGAMYFTRNGGVRNRIILFYDGICLAGIRFYGNNINELLAKSAIYRLIKDLGIFDEACKADPRLADGGEYGTTWYGYHDSVTLLYKDKNTKPDDIIIYQNVTEDYLYSNGLICYACGSKYRPKNAAQITCFECDGRYEQCIECEDIVPANEVYYTVDGEPYCVSCYDRYFTQCYCCNETVRLGDVISVTAYGDDLPMCESCADAETFVCTHCHRICIDGMANETVDGSACR